MRGKDRKVVLKTETARITPAYAGKSLTLPTSSTGKKDHPRLCGEKFWNDFKRFYFGGSPPPMRGKGHDDRRRRWHQGITPAYAGKSLLWLEQPVAFQDHPRLCGEKPERCICPHSLVGSPPPMRGKD